MGSQPDRYSSLLTEQDRQVLAASGHGQPLGLTTPCALLVIDMTYDFIGDRPEPILDSAGRFPQSCGEAGWAAVERLGGVLDAARVNQVPVIYTVRSVSHRRLESLSFSRKRDTGGRPSPRVLPESEQVPTVIAPVAGDIVIAKSKPSAFFNTPLTEYLVGLGIRQLVCCGATTSGCVRATVVDAFSHGVQTALIEDCTVDRFESSHQMAMFDMACKYADLVTADEAAAHFAGGAPRRQDG